MQERAQAIGHMRPNDVDTVNMLSSFHGALWGVESKVLGIDHLTRVRACTK